MRHTVLFSLRCLGCAGLLVAYGYLLCGCAYVTGPQGTAWAIGDATATSTPKRLVADGGTLSDNARLLVAQMVAAGVDAALRGKVPSAGELQGLCPVPGIDPDGDPAAP